MKRFSLVASLVFLGACLAPMMASALHDTAFEADAFLALKPRLDAPSFVFSPFEFELDSAIWSLGQDLDTRHKMLETLHYATKVEEAFEPIFTYWEAGQTNGFYATSARAYYLPRLTPESSKFRKQLLDDFNVISANVMDPKGGLEAWLKTSTEGAFDNYKMPISTLKASLHFEYWDFLALQVAWEQRFPTSNSRTLRFTCFDGSTTELPFMADVRPTKVWKSSRFLAVRIPMKDSCDFYALMPNVGQNPEVLSKYLTPEGISELLTIFDSIAVPGVTEGPAALVLPKMDLLSETKLEPLCEHFRFPTKGPSRLQIEQFPGQQRLVVRFTLAEQGRYEEPLAVKPADQVVAATADTPKCVFNRPFAFFIHQKETFVIPVAGVFTGKE